MASKHPGGKAIDRRITLITLTGSVDLASERRLRADLSAAAGDASRALVLDVRGVTFIDSTGLAILVHADHQFRRQGRTMACVIRADGPVDRLLHTTGIRDKPALFASLQEATSHVLTDRGHEPTAER
jgi:anti-sigma B factor antagonist